MNDKVRQAFALLKISETASSKEGKQAYHDLLSFWHPDKNRDKDRRLKLAEEETKKINAAYEVLTEFWETANTASAPVAPSRGNPSSGSKFTPETTEVALINTCHGQMVVEFWSDVAPGHVENFKKLARQGFYDGTAFHRVVKGFMIQGGDPLTKDAANEARWGTGGPGYKIKAEFNDRPHVRGVLSAARSSDPDSAGCQFFVCLADAKFLDRQYTAFGKVIAGDAVLEAIGSVETKNAGGGEKSRPTRRMSVESVQIVPRDSVKA